MKAPRTGDKFVNEGFSAACVVIARVAWENEGIISVANMLDGRMTFPIKGLKPVMLEINVYPDNAVIIVQYGRMAENIVTMLFGIDTACVLHKNLGDAILALSHKETKQ